MSSSCTLLAHFLFMMEVYFNCIQHVGQFPYSSISYFCIYILYSLCLFIAISCKVFGIFYMLSLVCVSGIILLGLSKIYLFISVNGVVSKFIGDICRFMYNALDQSAIFSIINHVFGWFPSLIELRKMAVIVRDKQQCLRLFNIYILVSLRTAVSCKRIFHHL